MLCTLAAEDLNSAIARLKHNQIAYLVRKVSGDKVNVFFGMQECVDIVRRFGNKSLNAFTDEEDFILGIMLGYCRIRQCRRYLKRKGHPIPESDSCEIQAFDNEEAVRQTKPVFFSDCLCE